MKPINFKDTYTHLLPYKIVCFGDSITSAAWTFPSWPEIIRYALVASEGIDWEPVIINTGCNNSNSQDQQNLLSSHVFSFSPEIVIYTLSLNDYIYDLPQEEYHQRTMNIVDQLTDNIKEVVICTPPASSNEKFSAGYSEYSKGLREELSKKKDIRFIDNLKYMQTLDRGPLYTKTFQYDVAVLGIKKGDIDFLHPNELGNAHIAQNILKKLFNIELNAETFTNSIMAGDRLPRLT